MKSFIEKNKNLSWKFPKTDLTDPVMFTKWLIKQDNFGWLRLDVDIDVEKWKEESDVIKEYYVSHRSHQNHIGWQGCAIHGIGPNQTETQDSDCFSWTEISSMTPTITNFWKNVFPSETYRRLRFMKLSPKGSINIHNDLPNGLEFKDLDPLNQTISINLAITHPYDCNMVLEDFGTIPWAEGSCFIINITRNHCVVNNSNEDRIHMIAECVIGNRLKDFSELIYRSYQRYHCD